MTEPAPNILLLIPHPDDEVVMASAMIGRAQRTGARLYAFYLTTGCVDVALLWPWQRRRHAARLQRRREEAEEAARTLGLTPLGFSSRPTRRLWQELPQAWQEVQALLARYPMDQIWVPAYEGGHPDHDALNGLASLLRPTHQVIEFAAYNWLGGHSHAHEFPFPRKDDSVIILTQSERAFKRHCLGIYASERGNLGYVGLRRENCRVLGDYDYRAPPHVGTVWYNRFHWVPFHHPRIDRTTPAQVSAALGRFLATCGRPQQ